jgi:hypothetical protein
MNRREFQLTLLTAFAPAAMHATEPVAAIDFEGCFENPAAAQAVGALYLQTYPEYASRKALLDVLALPTERLSRAQLASALERRIRADFAHQRTVLLDGWLLARAEAAVCGLIALG